MGNYGTTMEELRTMEAVQSINRKIPDIELRDLFAMNILGSFGGGSWNGSYLNILDANPAQIEKTARIAYKVADAMLEARKK